METIELTEKDLTKAAQLIQKGEVVAFPTDTVYGLGADATNEEAVRKIFQAKGRPTGRPLSVLVSGPSALTQFALDVSPDAKKLAETFWPGPLTLVLKNAHVFAPSVTAGKETVGLRMPANETALKFIEACRVPLATPSANSSGRPSPTLADHVKVDLGGKISAIIDGGETSLGVESTVLDFSDPKRPVILRPGHISKEAIEKVIQKKVFLPAETLSADSSKEVPKSNRHYEPALPVYIVATDFETAISEMKKRKESIALLASEEVIAEYRNCVTSAFSLGKTGDSQSANKRLFNGLRTLEQSKATVILAEPLAGGELAEVYMNRLESAANKKSI